MSIVGKLVNVYKKEQYVLSIVLRILWNGRGEVKKSTKKLVTSFMNSPLTELSMENNEVKPHDLAVPLSSKTHKTTM